MKLINNFKSIKIYKKKNSKNNNIFQYMINQKKTQKILKEGNKKRMTSIDFVYYILNYLLQYYIFRKINKIIIIY